MTLQPSPFGAAPNALAGERTARVLSVGGRDAAVAALTFLSSGAVFWLAIRGAPLGLIAALHGGVICVPLSLLLWRLRTRRELAIPALLLVGVALTGPFAAAGCAAMALTLWWRKPQPQRLQGWYDYIAGADQRTLLQKTYVELTSERLPSDFAAPIHRFAPILAGSSLAQQQRVLGLIGRHFHPDFHASLKTALRNRNILIRAQAAAIASLLGPSDKSRLWRRSALTRERPAELALLARLERTES